jgi:hypothetical protein
MVVTSSRVTHPHNESGEIDVDAIAPVIDLARVRARRAHPAFGQRQRRSS